MSGVPARVAVLGGGQMGAGIAHAFLLAGADVTVLERDAVEADRAGGRVRSALDESARRGADPAAIEKATAALRTVDAVAGLAGSALVVEAVPEDLEMKARMLSAVAAVAPEADLATNTSALSIDALASRLPEASRLIGLHFFNPVPASALVEIVVGAATDDGLVARAQDWVATMDKVPIVVRDSPGFASSRLGVALAIEAIRMLEEGVAAAEDIDRAMTLGYRHPVGPLRTTDVVGLDVRLAIAEHLAQELGARFEPPSLLREMVDAGKLGKKSGEGFFTWPN